MKECPVCKKQFGFFAGMFGKFREHVEGCEPAQTKYTTPSYAPVYTGTQAKERKVVDDSSFVTSIVVGAMTDNPLLGAVVGGSIVGGMLGASMHHEDSHSHTPDVSGQGGDFGGGGASSSWDSDSSSSSSYDSSSSDDSSSDSGSDW